MKKVALAVRKGIGPVTVWLDRAGGVVLVAMILMLAYSVIMRKFFTPMKGAGELSELGMVLVTFLFMGANYLARDSMCMDTYVEKLPRKGRWAFELVVQCINLAILIVLSWRLFVQAKLVEDAHQITATLRIPVYPFIYIAAACTVVLTLVYVVHFLDVVVKNIDAWKKRAAE